MEFAYEQQEKDKDQREFDFFVPPEAKGRNHGAKEERQKPPRMGKTEYRQRVEQKSLQAIRIRNAERSVDHGMQGDDELIGVGKPDGQNDHHGQECIKITAIEEAPGIESCVYEPTDEEGQKQQNAVICPAKVSDHDAKAQQDLFHPGVFLLDRFEIE